MFNFPLVIIIAVLQILPKYHCDPAGPSIVPTKGAVWPKPQQQKSFNKYFYVSKDNFEFKVTGKSCTILQNSLKYYEKIIFGSNALQEKTTDNQLLTRININLKKPCDDNEYPSLEMDEKYTLEVTDDIQSLEAESVWGILRGLETFSQILYPNGINNSLLKLKATKIIDYPRFPHRGLMLDTSRHFIPSDLIFTILEAMTFNKMNVFHWHIVDDQSFPYESQTFPNLSKEGAYSKSHTYPQSVIKEIIEFARLKGIRVIPEFDTPAHTSSWKGVPEVLTKCPEHENEFIIDPTKKQTYSFLQNFYQEITEVFHDEYIHLGGEEVDHDCWANDDKIRKFMEDNNMGEDYYALEHYYMKNLLEVVKHKKTLAWEDVYFNGAALSNTTIIQIWREEDNGYPALKKVVSSGYPSILSACWSLDDIEPGENWHRFYECDPHNINVAIEAKNRILGGEASMWSESVNEYNVVSRIWPRASIAAEKLWSKKNADSIEGAERRLEEHGCRMIDRGIPAQPPNSAGFC